MTNVPARSGNPIPAYLVPTPAGVGFALGAPDPDPARLVLNALLRGGSSRPMPLAMLAEVSGIGDRKSLGAILFALQRDGKLSGDVEPLAVAREPLGDAVPPLLEAMSTDGRGVLADDHGLCYAFAGYSCDEAQRLAACAPSAWQLLRRHREHVIGAANRETYTLALLDETAGARLIIRPLFVGEQVFHLCLSGLAHPNSPALTKLGALLLRRYVGPC